MTLEGVETLDAGVVPRVARAREPRVVRVALAGCGVVGGELLRILKHGEARLAARNGLRFEVVRVLARTAGRPRPDELPEGVLTTDLDAFLAAEAELVVEAIGGVDPAVRIARTALAAGRRVVTANKALVAAHGPELAALARQSGTRIDFEGAVAGGVPIVRALRDSLPLTGVRSIRGVLNGTSNYVLTRLAEGRSYADALARAQAAGFAEADPSRDVSGEDAADKIRILAWLAFGVAPERLPVRRRGIAPGADRLAADAAALRGVVRLVAECAQTAEGVVASVEPVVVGPGSELGRTRNEDNAVLVESDWNGRVCLAGPGAGGGPTASALLADMVRGAQRQPPPTQRRGVQDRRPHRWAVSVEAGPGAAEALRRALDRAGVPVAGEPLRGGSLARTAPVAWPRVDLATRALTAEGRRPLVSRVER
jgi:homoserine dehydrogenase